MPARVTLQKEKVGFLVSTIDIYFNGRNRYQIILELCTRDWIQHFLGLQKQALAKNEEITVFFCWFLFQTVQHLTFKRLKSCKFYNSLTVKKKPLSIYYIEKKFKSFTLYEKHLSRCVLNVSPSFNCSCCICQK